MVKMSAKDKNLGVVAVCDLWTKNREGTAARCKELFGNDVQKFKYSEDMLKMPDLDAVMIATGDFQHAKLLAEVVRAGKDCYCQWRYHWSWSRAEFAEKLSASPLFRLYILYNH